MLGISVVALVTVSRQVYGYKLRLGLRRDVRVQRAWAG